MKFGVTADERFPDFSLNREVARGLDGWIELTEAEHSDYLRVGKEYDAWQDRIRRELVRDKP